jgi:hypothetical protein
MKMEHLRIWTDVVPQTAIVILFGPIPSLGVLGSRGIWDPDEGRYTNVALTMLDSGNWGDPMRNGDTGHDGHRLMGRIIDDGQAFDDPAFGRTIEHEVHRPHLIGRRESEQGLPLGRWHLLAFTDDALATEPADTAVRPACGSPATPLV